MNIGRGIGEGSDNSAGSGCPQFRAWTLALEHRLGGMGAHRGRPDTTEAKPGVGDGAVFVQRQDGSHASQGKIALAARKLDEGAAARRGQAGNANLDRKSTRLNSSHVS